MRSFLVAGLMGSTCSGISSRPFSTVLPSSFVPILVAPVSQLDLRLSVVKPLEILEPLSRLESEC